jgi:hypothetical protein
MMVKFGMDMGFGSMDMDIEHLTAKKITLLLIQLEQQKRQSRPLFSLESPLLVLLV